MLAKWGKTFTMTTMLTLCITTSSYAGSGAFRVFASDAEVMGKGGAFAGEADNPSAIFYNPAGLTQLKGEHHISGGAALIHLNQSRTSPTGDKVQARRGNFLIPHVYAVSDFGLENVVFGVGSTSNFGLTTDWAKDSFSKYVATKTEIVNIDNYFTVGYAVNEQFSLAGGVIYDVAEINKNKQLIQAPSADGESQLKGEDEAFGYIVAAHYKPNERHSFGLMYRSSIELEYEGKVHLTNLNSSLTNLSGIFGGSSYTTDAEADLELPQSIVIGYSFKPDDKWRFNFDVEWMDWSSIEQERVRFPSETDATRLAVLAASTDTDRDWNSTYGVSAGVEYAVNDRLRLRGGYFFNEDPIPTPTVDPSLITAKVHAANLGFGYDLKEDLTLDMAWTGMFFNDRDVFNNVGDATGDIDGTYETFANLVLATLNYRFH